MTADPLATLEAILFTCGRSVEAGELAGALGVPAAEARRLLRALAKRYDATGGALEVMELGGRWSIQVREAYQGAAAPWAAPDLPREVLRTAALIAYHQPIKQSRLVALAGGRAYRDVTTLARMKLIAARASGNTLELTTTPMFAEYFGLKVATREEVKELMARRISEADSGGPRPSPDDNQRRPFL